MLKSGSLGHESSLAAKLKLATFFELMNTQTRCSFHLGNLGAVTKKSCFDVRVFLIFLNFFIFIFFYIILVYLALLWLPHVLF